ncbi:MAG: hypothetical protein H0W83_17030, partial [Planctomycetes bacterium]|nr:hypothetical protein [Planctomycetota bacterium]
MPSSGPFRCLAVLGAVALHPDSAAGVEVCVRDHDAPVAAVGLVEVVAPDGAYAGGVTVVAQPGGQAVGAQVLWQAPGEPV